VERVAPVARADDVVAVAAEVELERLGEVVVVLDDEDAGAGGGGDGHGREYRRQRRKIARGRARRTGQLTHVAPAPRSAAAATGGPMGQLADARRARDG
jgi:hypothetical protein